MAQKVIWHKYVKYTCSMEIVQQNGRFTLVSSKFPSNIYSILYDHTTPFCIVQYRALSYNTVLNHTAP